jgi:hypothetical protein
MLHATTTHLSEILWQGRYNCNVIHAPKPPPPVILLLVPAVGHATNLPPDLLLTCTIVALSNLSRIVCSKLPSARSRPAPPPDTGNVSDRCRNGCTPPLLLLPRTALLLLVLLPGSRLLSTRGRTSCCPATPLFMLA